MEVWEKCFLCFVCASLKCFILFFFFVVVFPLHKKCAVQFVPLLSAGRDEGGKCFCFAAGEDDARQRLLEWIRWIWFSVSLWQTLAVQSGQKCFLHTHTHKHWDTWPLVFDLSHALDWLHRRCWEGVSAQVSGKHLKKCFQIYLPTIRNQKST